MVMAPTTYRALIDRLPHLGHARCTYNAPSLVKAQTGRVPLQPTPGDQPPRRPFQVGDDLFVIDLQHRHRQHLTPVLHEPMVLTDARTDMFQVTRPADVPEMRQP